MAGALVQRVDQQPREARTVEAGLQARRAAELVVQFVAHRVGVGARGSAAPQRRRGQHPGAQREEDPFARDRIDEAGGIAEQHPSVAGRLLGVHVARRRATESARRSGGAAAPARRGRVPIQPGDR